MSISTEMIINIGIILGITILTIILIRTVVIGSLLKLTGKSKTTHDDAIVAALKKPFTLIPIGIALFAIIQEIELSNTYQTYAELIIKSYFYLAIFWSLADAITPIRDYVGETYDFLTTTLRNWIFRTLKFISYLIGVVSVLELWGVGAQNFFKNLIGGLLIIGEKRFKQGDWINIDGVAEGEVEKIDFRSTLIRRFDKAPIFVPNSVLSDSEIINFSEMPFRRIRFNVGLIYQTSPETILNIRKDIEEYIAKNDDLVNADEATTTIRVTQFNDSSIDLLIYCFTKSTKWHDFTMAKENLILEIMKIVKKNGSDFAYPTRTIHIEKD